VAWCSKSTRLVTNRRCGRVRQCSGKLDEEKASRVSSTKLQLLQARIQELGKSRQIEPERPIVTYQYGQVRYGTLLESRIHGILITKDNLSTILQSFGNARRTWLSRVDKIIKTQTRYFLLEDPRALHIMEQVWTGDSAYSTTLSHMTLPCSTLVSVQVRFWVTGNWELVRELNYFAITEDAYDGLISSRAPEAPVSSKEGKRCRVSVEQLVSFMEAEELTFRGDFFLRCLERQVLFLHLTPRIVSRNDARIQGK
jgi:hypothetical protein